jgi:hypothetical protein
MSKETYLRALDSLLENYEGDDENYEPTDEEIQEQMEHLMCQAHERYEGMER